MSTVMPTCHTTPKHGARVLVTQSKHTQTAITAGL